ncbi:MAG: FAD-dependent monooxygenase [Aestuariivita sp.]|nr:FAD-dependent monooxygenase [Aestuariivita sp.]MCY4203277.1 FAD-dependent monooxygenase [Aestuariivita sp.]
MAYTYRPYPHSPIGKLQTKKQHHPVVIVGAGPVGLALAIDLASRNIASLVLDENNVVSVGSRAICWAKRTLEIFDRLGVGERMLAKGITWKIGRQFHGDQELFSFDLLPETGHKYPAFINLQQYYVEQYLIERTRDFPELIEIRFKHEVINHIDHGDHVGVSVSTPEGRYSLNADWYIACDGAGSTSRERMGLGFTGKPFEEKFLIADIEMETSPFGSEAIAERWFWFDPTFHAGKSALFHMQPDNIYRIDLQLDATVTAQAEKVQDFALSRIRAIVGEAQFRLDWSSIYRFRCARLDNFVHGRVVFAGDSAHIVSPFGARGGNGGIQDADNLGWKLAAVINGQASSRLIETYHDERSAAADENIQASSRTTNFMTPKSAIESLFRSETLKLAVDQPFARTLLNSGRLSVPFVMRNSSLQTLRDARKMLGSAAVDLPLAGDGTADKGWLIEQLQGLFVLVGFGAVELPQVAGVRRIGINQNGGDVSFCAEDQVVRQRYGINIAYLFRPDGHICAAFESPTVAAVTAARDYALTKHR